MTALKDREAELARALERSRLAETVMNSVRDPVFVKDENLRFVLVNNAFARLHGVEPAEMLGKVAADFLPEKAAEFEASEQQVLDTGEPYEAGRISGFHGIGRSRIVRKNRVTTTMARTTSLAWCSTSPT